MLPPSKSGTPSAMIAARSFDCCQTRTSSLDRKLSTMVHSLLLRLSRRNHVAAAKAGKFSDDRIVPGFPRGKFRVGPGADLGCGDEDGWSAHFASASWEKIRSALKGRLSKRIPVASAKALPRAGATGIIGVSPADFAPSGP